MSFKHYKGQGFHQLREGKSGTVTSRINISHDHQLNQKRTPLKEIIERCDISNLSGSFAKNSTTSTLSRILGLDSYPKSSKDLLNTLKSKTIIQERQPSLKHLKTDTSQIYFKGRRSDRSTHVNRNESLNLHKYSLMIDTDLMLNRSKTQERSQKSKEGFVNVRIAYLENIITQMEKLRRRNKNLQNQLHFFKENIAQAKDSVLSVLNH